MHGRLCKLRTKQLVCPLVSLFILFTRTCRSDSSRPHFLPVRLYRFLSKKYTVLDIMRYLDNNTRVLFLLTLSVILSFNRCGTTSAMDRTTGTTSFTGGMTENVTASYPGPTTSAVICSAQQIVVERRSMSTATSQYTANISPEKCIYVKEYAFLDLRKTNINNFNIVLKPYAIAYLDSTTPPKEIHLSKYAILLNAATYTETPKIYLGKHAKYHQNSWYARWYPYSSYLKYALYSLGMAIAIKYLSPIIREFSRQ
jgi:hypothetical protein